MTASAGPSDLVWYAAYGSNLLRARFLAYLEGGSIGGTDGSGPVEEGAADSSLPVDDRPLRLDGWQLAFAGESRRWNGGGVCAVVPGAGEVLGRAWLITIGQLRDVWRQENSGVALVVDDVVSAVTAVHQLDAARGSYRRLAPLGHLDGRPVMTITGTQEVVARVNAPDPAYRQVVAAGLAETWVMSPGDINRYLARSLGIRSSVSPGEPGLAD